MSRGMGRGVSVALKGEALQDFLEFALRGYTVRRIKELMEERGWGGLLQTIPDAYLINLIRDSVPQLDAGRDDLDKGTLKRFGLASKMERVRRLCEAAEAIEKSVPADPKWSAEYRRFLNQIQLELEPLGIEVSLSDSWAQLLDTLAKAGQESVEESGLDTTEATD